MQYFGIIIVRVEDPNVFTNPRGWRPVKIERTFGPAGTEFNGSDLGDTMADLLSDGWEPVSSQRIDGAERFTMRKAITRPEVIAHIEATKAQRKHDRDHVA